MEVELAAVVVVGVVGADGDCDCDDCATDDGESESGGCYSKPEMLIDVLAVIWILLAGDVGVEDVMKLYAVAVVAVYCTTPAVHTVNYATATRVGCLRVALQVGSGHCWNCSVCGTACVAGAVGVGCDVAAVGDGEDMTASS